MTFAKLKEKIISHKLISCLIAFGTISVVTLSITLPIFLINENNNYLEFSGFEKTTVEKINSTNDSTIDKTDALMQDVNEKAKLKDEVFVYNLAWGAVFHKYGIFAHMIKLLELNPNANVILFSAINLNTNLINRLKAFPNFTFIQNPGGWAQKLSSNEQDLINNSWFSPDLKNALDAETRAINLYTDDYFILNKSNCLLEYFTGNSQVHEQVILRLYEYINFLAKFKTINMFADGTASAYFYSNAMYANYLRIGFDVQSGRNLRYMNSTNFQDKLDSGTLNFYEFKANNHWWYQSIFSFVTTSTKGNTFNKTKYFLPDIKMVEEMNALDTSYLDLNDKNNDYFDPYNSLTSNLISFVSSFNTDSMNILFSAFITTFEDNVFPSYDMDNAINYVYSGVLMGGDIDKINQNATVLKNIYENAKKENANKKINVWFKGHPRDNHQILSVLRNAIKQLDPTDNVEWLNAIDKSIPFELYLCKGYFNNNSATNKVVKLFTSYSTIQLFLHANNKIDQVQKTYVTQEEFNSIKSIYGENSTIFPAAKLEIR